MPIQPVGARTDIDPSLVGLPGFDKPIKKVLDQSDFLKLLTVQFANQDPLKPTSDTAFIAQMAGFASNEQMSEVAASLKAFTTRQDFISAQNYLGREVTIKTSSGTLSGIVEETAIIGKIPTVFIAGRGYDASLVVSVRAAPAGTGAPATPGAGTPDSGEPPSG